MLQPGAAKYLKQPQNSEIWRGAWEQEPLSRCLISSFHEKLMLQVRKLEEKNI